MGLLLAAALLMFAPQGERIGTYKEELAAARRAGLPTTPADMKRPAIPESKNAAPLYSQLDALLKSRPESARESEQLAVLSDRAKPSAAQVAEGQGLLAARQPELRLIHEITRRPKCQFGRDWSQGPYMTFPEFSRMRAAARLLMAESGLMLRQGKAVAAVENMSLGFRIAGHAQQDSAYIGHLVSIAIDAITLRGIENILEDAGDRPGVPAMVMKALQEKWSPRSLAKTIGSEIVMQARSIEVIRADPNATVDSMTSMWLTAKPKKPASPAERRRLEAALEASGAYTVHTLVQLAAVADSSYPIASAVFKRRAAEADRLKDPNLALASILLPVFASAPTQRARIRAKVEVLRASAALLAWRQNHAGFPDHMDRAIHPIPVDPFDLTPLRYRRIGAGFVVYSVGETGRFSGSASDNRQYNREAVFRYPFPAGRAGQSSR